MLRTASLQESSNPGLGMGQGSRRSAGQNHSFLCDPPLPDAGNFGFIPIKMWKVHLSCPSRSPTNARLSTTLLGDEIFARQGGSSGYFSNRNGATE